MTRRMMFLALSTLIATMGAGISAHKEVRIVGTLTKVETASITVKKADSKIVTILFDKDTDITRDNVKVSASELKVGRTVVVDACAEASKPLMASEIKLVPPTAASK
jgi:hypothetical protein